MYNCLEGGVNMREAQVYIKKHLKNRTNYTELGGVISQLGDLYPPMGEGGV